MSDFINSIQKNLNTFTKVGLLQFNRKLKLWGTTVTVKRLSSSEEYLQDDTNPTKTDIFKEVYGDVSMNEEIPVNHIEHYETFSLKLIINKTSELKFYDNQVDVIKVYLNTDELELGDVVSYKYINREYSFKVIEKDSLEDVLYSYDLLGIKEVDDQSEYTEDS